jgi:hypothetical protein
MRVIPLLAAWTTIAALGQELLPPQTEPQVAAERYAIYLDNSMYGGWNYELDPMDPAAMHAEYGHEYAWFRQGANRYVVNDAGVLDQLRQAVEPRNTIDHARDELNLEKRRLDMVRMSISLRQRTAVQLGEKLGDASRVQAMRAALDREQAQVDLQQQRVNERQQKIDADAKSVSADSDRRILYILDSALLRGLAHRLQ